jgi:hypothetical protein
LWHTLTAGVAAAALLLQLVLVIRGGHVLAETDPPGLALRLARFVSYFTIQSNLLVLAGTALLARRPDRDEPWFRALRLAGVVGITVTGVVHFLLLRPLLDLAGWDWAADKLLHMVVPVLAVVGWAVFGPRPRTDGTAIRRAFAWPVAWLAWTLAVGAISGWFPYPFLDFDAEGWGHVLLVSAGVTGFAAALFALVAYADRRLPPAPTA